jgi:hypothetical protein
MCVDDGLMCLAPGTPPGPLVGDDVRSWSVATKIEAAIRRALPHLPGDAAGKLMELLSPTTLAILATTLVLWAGSHAIGVGEAVDILMLIGGFVFIGFEAYDALKHLIAFVQLSVGATSEHDLDLAGDHLARAIAIIGVDIALAVLTHGAGKIWKGRYRPTTTGTRTLPKGAGETSPTGDIRYSLHGTDEDRALVLLHEKVHQFFTPRIEPLRRFRVNLRMEGYEKVQLLRYLEEALAEGYAQLRVRGIKGLPEAMNFPLDHDYGLSLEVVRGQAIKLGLAYLGTIVVGGIAMYVYLESE